MTNAQDPVATFTSAPSAATPAGLDSLLELFHTELGSVQFPGVDAKVLAAAAERVREAGCDVRRAEVELEAARAQLLAAQEEALLKGQRALAYARIYAQDAPELLARLDAVALTSVAAPAAGVTYAPAAPPRRRGRPPKSATVTSLFGDGAAESAPSLEDAAT